MDDYPCFNELDLADQLRVVAHIVECESLDPRYVAAIVEAADELSIELRGAHAPTDAPHEPKP
jgi:hypothetical protein